MFIDCFLILSYKKILDSISQLMHCKVWICEEKYWRISTLKIFQDIWEKFFDNPSSIVTNYAIDTKKG